MYEKFHRDLERPSVDKEKSLAYLCGSGLKGEMDSLIKAAQEQHSVPEFNALKWNSIRVIIIGT